MRPGSAVFVSLVKTNAPDFLSGVLKWWLKRNSPKQVHDFLMGNGHILDLVPQNYQNVLMEMRPFKTDWLTLEWVIKVVNKHSPEVALMLAGSQCLMQRLGEEVQLFKEQLKKD